MIGVAAVEGFSGIGDVVLPPGEATTATCVMELDGTAPFICAEATGTQHTTANHNQETPSRRFNLAMMGTLPAQFAILEGNHSSVNCSSAGEPLGFSLSILTIQGIAWNTIWHRP
jgi:hypothetical protein